MERDINMQPNTELDGARQGRVASGEINDFLQQLEDYTTTVPDAVSASYLNVSGFDGSDPRIVRFVSLAAQKFVSDIANDALQHCKVRCSNQPIKTKGKDRRYTLALEDLQPALGEFGILLRKPHYFV